MSKNQTGVFPSADLFPAAFSRRGLFFMVEIFSENLAKVLALPPSSMYYVGVGNNGKRHRTQDWREKMTNKQNSWISNLVAAAEKAIETNENYQPSDECAETKDRLAKAQAALDAHLATDYPGADRYGRWRKQWNITARSLKADVDYYKSMV